MGKTVVGIFAADHHSYQIDGNTDLTPTRTQAEARRVDKRHPEDTVIHFHKRGESCFGRDHESYRIGSTEVVKVNPIRALSS